MPGDSRIVPDLSIADEVRCCIDATQFKGQGLGCCERMGAFPWSPVVDGCVSLGLKTCRAAKNNREGAGCDERDACRIGEFIDEFMRFFSCRLQGALVAVLCSHGRC